MYPMNGPEVMVNFAQNKFDSNGKLTDEDTKRHLKGLLENLADWTKRLRK
jgi:chromate reductase